MDTMELHSGNGKEWSAMDRRGEAYSPDAPYPPSLRDSDNKDMYRMGKAQEFNRNFKVVSISSFCLATMMGFVFIPINAPILIGVAGTGGAIVMYICNFFGFFTVVMSLAEMSSMAPTAGGQYHWTSEFAPPKFQKFLSYISGWLSSLSWLTGVGSAMFIAGNLVPALAALLNPDYVPEPYQGYLLVLTLSIIIFSINGFAARHLPLLEGFVLVFMIMAFTSILIVLLVLSPKLTGAEVFGTFLTGLDTKGELELVAAQSVIFYSLLGSDATAHMAEETQHANKVIPRAMIGSYVIMGILNFVLLIVFCFCFVDPVGAANTTNGYPFLEVFINSTGSASGAVALTSLMLVLITLSATNFMASTSRQLFAFARDDGLPFPKFIAKINPRTGSPINSLLVVFIFTILLALIGLGSTVAFNAVISLQGMAIAATYQVSMLCLIWRRLAGKPLPPRPWSLGVWGLPMNILGSLYGFYLLIYCAMPSAYPVTAANLNYAPVIFGGIMVLSLLYYVVWARRIYVGPVLHVREM